ncbi:MAG: amidohydrolase/deacetylase family metallohydrolase [Anaerolineae bacterium]|nr:amidohydrolase/deacetylase family metallohydrolase [Anaerolineae bacterium]
MNTDRPDTKHSFDIVLKGGHVIDPANGIDIPLDVGITDKRIARVAADIPETEATQVVDVGGCYVTPGILDIHTHVYTFRPVTDSYVGGMNADAHLLASGVTTTVDAGTAGWMDWPDFKAACIDKATVRILAFLNIAARGMVDSTSEQHVPDLDAHIAAAVVNAYPELLVGIKTAHYWTRKPWDTEHPPWVSVERAVEAGELCGKPVMVDFWPRPPERPYPTLILEKLRPGDIHTHVFAQQFPILDEDGHVCEYMFQARERGVVFDLGHGAGSFWFRNAVPALRDNFPPDSISTDFHMGNVNGPVVSMLHTMSKYVSMGMPLQEVIMRSTVIPAREIGRPELGTLSIGAEADIAVLRQWEGTFGFTDCGHAKLTGNTKLECMMTLRAGKIVYDPTGMSMPEWEQAPASYWEMPALQA